MPVSIRKLFSSVVVLSALALGATPADAKPVHHHKHHPHAVVKHASKTSGSEITRIVQKHLASLGYYSGSIDGKMGPQTRLAIENFQRDHGLKLDSIPGPKTRAALAAADHSSMAINVPPPVVIDPNAVTNPGYTTNLTAGAKALPSRFARVDVSESGTGADKRYIVNLNGQPILTADGQPAVIGMSQTFSIGEEDAIVFTSFSPSDTGCIYRTHVLVMNNSDSKILDVGNCTRDYQASVHDGSLYITFPEHDDARAVGQVWRLQGESVERL